MTLQHFLSLCGHTCQRCLRLHICKVLKLGGPLDVEYQGSHQENSILKPLLALDRVMLALAHF
jgi:hypothetical protein